MKKQAKTKRVTPFKHEAERAVRTLLEYIGDDPNREGLYDTPRRVVKMFEERLSSLLDLPPVVSVFKDTRTQGQVIQADIPFYSYCEHHLVPFFGRVDVGYMPNSNHVIGLSKIARIVEHFAKRPQIQEQLTAQITDFIMKLPNLKPDGVMVVVRAQHLCIESRGVSKPGTVTITSEIRGKYTDAALRNEFLILSRR